MELSEFPFKSGTCLSQDFIRLLHEGQLAEPALSLGLDHILACPDCQACLSAQMESRPPLYPGLSAANGPLPELDTFPKGGAKGLPFQSTGEPDASRAALWDNPLGKKYGIDQFLETQACTFQYRGIDLSTGQKVRLTFLRPEYAHLEDFCEALLERSRAVQRIVNPYVLPILHEEKTALGPVIVSPYLGPRRLSSLIEADSLSTEQIEHFAQCLLEGLTALHRGGLVHGPLMPSGILCSPKSMAQGEITLWNAVLGDAPFGARFLHETIQNGVVPYQSPEQSMGREPNFRSDFFSLGCVLFELLTGGKAWSLPDAMDQPNGTLDAPGLNAASREVLRPLLELEPSDRPANHEEVARILKNLTH